LALYVGTGIGSAFIDGGKLVRGVRNQAFEIGHIPYKETPLACGCGKKNCIELYASASGMNKWMIYYKMPKLTLAELEKSEYGHDKEIALGFKEALLFAVATLLTLTNPKKLVLGGGVMKRNPYLLEWLKDNLKGQAFSNALQEVTIHMSELQNGAIEGAKLLEEKSL
jgi:glucokinase